MSDSQIPLAPPEAERLFEERGLSERERDAARSVICGMTADEAATALGISASTVGSLRQRAYHKLDVRGAAELAERFGEKRDRPTPPLPDDTVAQLRARGLSETQAEVLARAAAGRSTAEIAEELHVAPGTVSSARANGYRLLGVHTREELAVLLADEGTPSRKQSRRAVAVLICVALAVAGLVAAAWWTDGEGRRTASGGEDLVGVSHTLGIVDLEKAVDGYYDLGARDVQVTCEGDVDNSYCLIVRALSDGDPRDAPNGLYEDATIYLTVTSDTTLPPILDEAPLDATRILTEAGLVPDPQFSEYHRPPDDTNIHEPRVESASVDGEQIRVGTELRVGTIVHLEFNGSLDGYSWREVGPYYWGS